MSEPLRLRPVVRSRASRFSYVCRACRRCCHDKRIMVNPYEVARMARHLGLSTIEFFARCTQDGVALATVGDACIFLTGDGCAVHPDRPLACRLYPLGRVAGAEGQELFVEFEPSPASEGSYGEAGTVAEFLEAQGVEPYLRVADRYYEALVALAAAVAAALSPVAPADGADPPQPPPAAIAPVELLDLDSAAAAMAARRGIPVPSALEARLELHLAWLHELAAGSAPTS